VISLFLHEKLCVQISGVPICAVVWEQVRVHHAALACGRCSVRLCSLLWSESKSLYIWLHSNMCWLLPLPTKLLFLIVIDFPHSLLFLWYLDGTKWPSMCWCAVKKLLITPPTKLGRCVWSLSDWAQNISKSYWQICRILCCIVSSTTALYVFHITTSAWYYCDIGIY